MTLSGSVVQYFVLDVCYIYCSKCRERAQHRLRAPLTAGGATGFLQLHIVIELLWWMQQCCRPEPVYSIVCDTMLRHMGRRLTRLWVEWNRYFTAELLGRSSGVSEAPGNDRFLVYCTYCSSTAALASKRENGPQWSRVTNAVASHAHGQLQICCRISRQGYPSVHPWVVVMQHMHLESTSTQVNLPWLSQQGLNARMWADVPLCAVQLLRQAKCRSAAAAPLSLSLSSCFLSHCSSLALQGNHWCLWVPQFPDDAAHNCWCRLVGISQSQQQQRSHTDLMLEKGCLCFTGAHYCVACGFENHRSVQFGIVNSF